MAPAPAVALFLSHCCSFLRSPLRLSGSAPRSRALFCSSTIRSRGLKNHKYEKNPTKYWDEFYKRHNNKFFKDRHYLEKDWGRFFLLSSEVDQPSANPKIVLEVGCGAGNSLFPLLAAFPYAFVHACDFSPHAIALVKAHEAFRSDQVNAFVCDLTVDDLCKTIVPASVDVVTMCLQ